MSTIRPGLPPVSVFAAERVAAWWSRRKATLLCVACAGMATAALVWLGYQFWRLIWAAPPVWPSSPPGAIDLRIIRGLIDKWFLGVPIYRQEGTALYPPASYVLLWPFVGWLPPVANRVFCALTSVVALAWLAATLTRLSGAGALSERWFVALLPVSTYAAGAAIGNGQITVQVLALVVAAATTASRRAASWRHDILEASLWLFALAKPSLVAPFLLLPIVRGRVRVVCLTATAYAAISLWAGSYQGDSLPALVRGWLGVGARVGASAGVANIHLWLGALGWQAFAMPASLALLLLLAWWSVRHRRDNLLVMLGVVAIITRLWTYHSWYDDLLLVLPMVALFSVAKGAGSRSPRAVIAGLLLTLTAGVMLAPGGLFLLPAPWNGVYLACETAIWLADLALLAFWGVTSPDARPTGGNGLPA